METCFAMKMGKCGAMEKGCPGYEVCPFYKTQAQSDEDRRKAFERIAGLPLPRQSYIAETYYNGRYPWIANNAEA